MSDIGVTFDTKPISYEQVLAELEAIFKYYENYHSEIEYDPNKYNLLHGIKFNKQLPDELVDKVRESSKSSLEAAFQLKTYYAYNNIESVTIVLKNRALRNEVSPLCLDIPSDCDDGSVNTCEQYAIEIFNDHGKYKVLDILNSNKSVLLKEFLDRVCKSSYLRLYNIRYDMGYLGPCHKKATNLREFNNILKFLTAKCNVGKPLFNIVDIGEIEGSQETRLSDDMFISITNYAKSLGMNPESVYRRWIHCYTMLVNYNYTALSMLYGSSKVYSEEQRVRLRDTISNTNFMMMKFRIKT